MRDINTIPLILTRNCNFNCEYCFGEHDRKDMTEQVLKDSIDWADDYITDNKTIKMRFFGGEPTVKWGLIEKAIEYKNNFHDRRFRFTLTTNGYALNEEKIDFLADHDIRTLFSMDGIKPSHNMHRRTASGEDSFEQVDNNLRMAIDKGITNSVRLTFTNKTLKYLVDNYKYYSHELGVFSQFTPVNDTLSDFTEKELKIYNEQFDKIQELVIDGIIANNDPKTQTYKRSFDFLKAGRKTSHFCSAGAKYVALDYNGDIYPCHRFIYYPEWVIGNIYDDQSFDEEKRNIFLDYDISQRRSKCDECDVGFCGGNCYASNYSKTGDIYVASDDICQLHKDEWKRAKKAYQEVNNLIQFKKIYKRR